MAEIVGAAPKRKFDNRRFNFQRARARARPTPAGRIVEERKKKGFQKKKNEVLSHIESTQEREDNARSFSMTTSRIEMARKMATAPKGEIFEVSNFISLLSLLPS